MKACRMCLNARIDDNLTDDNDLSYIPVGKTTREHRIMIASGNGKPLSIDVEMLDEKIGQWVMVGMYNPKFCPNCGREILEYGDRDENGL